MSGHSRGEGTTKCAVRDCERPKVARDRKHCPFHAMTLPLEKIMPTAMKIAKERM